MIAEANDDSLNQLHTNYDSDLNNPDSVASDGLTPRSPEAEPKDRDQASPRAQDQALDAVGLPATDRLTVPGMDAGRMERGETPQFRKIIDHLL